MSPRDWPLRVADILEAAEEIQAFTRGMTFEEFAADQRTIKAVLADFTIIGEAARHLPEEVAARVAGVDWEAIRKMRNIIVHVYFGVNLRIVWSTIQNDLAPLRAQLQELLDANKPDDPAQADTP